jgi:hypothetical protein
MEVLESGFEKWPAEAYRIMLRAHADGDGRGSLDGGTPLAAARCTRSTVCCGFSSCLVSFDFD